MDPAVTAGTAMANSFRFSGQPRWFDFYNCRVFLPEHGVFFYAMPYMLSGAKAPQDKLGLYLYDGGNAGPAGRSVSKDIPIAREGWTASDAGCDVRWNHPETGEAQWFTEGHIKLHGPLTTWDVKLESFLFDRDEPITDPRRFKIEEKTFLRQVPFIHRVPRMKGWASGVIEQEGNRFEFERGVVYQAKNHGHNYPENWTWIHVNHLLEDENIAFEAAGLNSDKGDAAMIRISTPDGVRFISTWAGDNVRLKRAGDHYTFGGTSADGSLEVEGEAVHGDNVVFHFPSPDGSTCENDECFVGKLSVKIDGKTYTTGHAALGYLHRVD